MKDSITVPLAIAVGGVIVAAAVYVSMPKPPTMSAGLPALVRPIGASDHILGNPAAEVMIVEYTDFDCEYCRGFHETLHHIVANAGANGKVAWVLRHFPLSEIHPNALPHARASECAAQVGGNDAFWKFADLLFNNQPVNPIRYGELARSSGMPGDSAFASCYANATTLLDERIMADRQNALAIGATGTPYSLILVAGKPPMIIDDAYPYDAVKQLVDEALAQ